MMRDTDVGSRQESQTFSNNGGLEAWFGHFQLQITRYIDVEGSFAIKAAFPEPYPLQKRSLFAKNKTWGKEGL